MPIDGIPDEYEQLFLQQAGGTFNPALGNAIATNPHAFAMHLASQGIPPPPPVQDTTERQMSGPIQNFRPGVLAPSMLPGSASSQGGPQAGDTLGKGPEELLTMNAPMSGLDEGTVTGKAAEDYAGAGNDAVSYPPTRDANPALLQPGETIPIPRPAPGLPRAPIEAGPIIPAPPDGTQGPSTADLRGVSKDLVTSGPPSGTTPGGMLRPGSPLDRAYSWAFGPSTAAAADLGGPRVRGPEPRVPDYPLPPPRATRSPGTDIGAPLAGQIDPRSIPPPVGPAADASKTSRQDATTMSPFAGITAPRPPEVQKISSPSAHAPIAINAQNLAELLKLLQGASAPAPNVLRLNPAIAGR